jgi:hypothetical protein
LSEEPFEPQNEIERLLVVATDDSARREEFRKALLLADLCFATPDPIKSPAPWIATGDETLQMLGVVGPDGTSLPAVFTSPMRIAEVFGPDAAYYQMNAKTLLGMLVQHGVWLNPRLAYGVHWDPSGLSHLLSV